MFYPFLLTMISGFSTMIGTIFIFIKFKNKDYLVAASSSFATGIMVSISILDLIPESLNNLSSSYSKIMVIIICTISLFLGMIFSLILDKFIDIVNKNSNLYKLGILSMITIIMHNIPEGIITFVISNNNIVLGIPLCLAIALHNIPEGISIAIPIYYATRSKKKAFLYTFISAISEPLGAILAKWFLLDIINNKLLGILFAMIAGIMLHLSLFNLLKAGTEYNKKLAILYIFIGFIVMYFSLQLNSLIA